MSCNSGTTLSSGESMKEVIKNIEQLDTEHQIEAIGVNCSKFEFIDELISQIRSETKRTIIVYPNSGENWDSKDRSWIKTEESVSGP